MSNGRTCGDCTLCCKLLPVPEIGKLASHKCSHQRHTGCTVYHDTKRGFPISCAVWSCMWLLDSDLNCLRPDRSGYVVDMMPDIIIAGNHDTGETTEVTALQVWCDLARPDAWNDPHLFRYAKAHKFGFMLVRYNSAKAITVIMPWMSPTGKMIVIDTGIKMPSVTGSLLLDRLEGHPTPGGAV